MEELYVTHVVPRPNEPNAYVKTNFFVSNESRSRYYFGFDMQKPISPEEMTDRVISGCADPVQTPSKISLTGGKSVWLSPDLEFLIASNEDPVRDRDKVLIHKVHVESKEK